MKTLLMINLRALFSGIFMKSRSVKKRSPVVTVLIALLVIYVVGTFFVMSGFLFYQLCTPLVSTGYGWLYFALMGITVFALCFVGSLFATQSQLFNAKDNDQLLSLPIKPFSILMSRVAALLLLDYLFEVFLSSSYLRRRALIVWVRPSISAGSQAGRLYRFCFVP
jgi:ABC-2 type transport system permease protein